MDRVCRCNVPLHQGCAACGGAIPQSAYVGAAKVFNQAHEALIDAKLAAMVQVNADLRAALEESHQRAPVFAKLEELAHRAVDIAAKIDAQAPAPAAEYPLPRGALPVCGTAPADRVAVSRHCGSGVAGCTERDDCVCTCQACAAPAATVRAEDGHEPDITVTFLRGPSPHVEFHGPLVKRTPFSETYVPASRFDAALRRADAADTECNDMRPRLQRAVDGAKLKDNTIADLTRQRDGALGAQDVANATAKSLRIQLSNAEAVIVQLREKVAAK